MHLGIMLYWILLALVAFSFLADEILSLLNASVQRSDIDPRVVDFYDGEKYRKTLSYQKDKDRFNRVFSIFSFIITISLLSSGSFGRIDALIATAISPPYLRALVFFGALSLAMDLLSLPFEIYNTFTLEGRYGFNKTTAKTFVTDKLKGYVLSAILGGGILYLFMLIIAVLGSWFWLAFSAVAILIIVFINMFYTSLFLPLFNKLKPLSEGELKTALETYARAQNISLSGIYVMDGSKRSTKANAFFSGIGSQKKIVLFDTLIEKHPIDELVAVLAHEAGHLKLHHIPQALLLSIAQIIFTLWVFSLFVANPALSLAMGGSAYALELNLYAFGILFGPIAAVTGLASLILSRRNEYQADAFAAKTSSSTSMASALKRLSADNLSNLYPHPAFVFFRYSHPSLLQRLDGLERN
ncbi:M48 family metallopeptidase [Treponema sp.]